MEQSECLSVKENWFNLIFLLSFISATDITALSGVLFNHHTSVCVRYRCKILHFAR